MTDASGGNVFFVRCKPYGIDAIELARDNSIVFLGYPLGKPGSTYDPASMHRSLTSLTSAEEEWTRAKAEPDQNYRKQAQANRNLALDVRSGDIALLPHAREGMVYAGVVLNGFELLDSPPWLKDFLDLLPPDREALPEEQAWHAAEVAQVCRVRAFIPIAISELGHVRASLLSRSRFGRVRLPEGNAHRFFCALMNDGREPRRWSTDPGDIILRLQHDLTPTDFEYLTVALLQLEFPDQQWRVFAGAGDGGIDGLAIDDRGRPVAVVQCKLRYDGSDVFGEEHRQMPGAAANVRRFVAALFHPPHVNMTDDVHFLDSTELVQLVLKHHSRLPLALTLRVGTESAVAR